MSLVKTYQLGCEAFEILMRREMKDARDAEHYGELLRASRAERSKAIEQCMWKSIACPTAREARTIARKGGWVRLELEVPLYAGSDQTTVIRYDVCPCCAPNLEEPAPDRECLDCHGTGKREWPQSRNTNPRNPLERERLEPQVTKCGPCKGTGRVAL